MSRQFSGQKDQAGLKGATVTKTITGYIGDDEIQKPRSLSLAENLPVIIEIIDSEGK